MENKQAMPILLPVEPEEFWQQMRSIVREEIEKKQKSVSAEAFSTPGLVYKPLYKMTEVCKFFQVSRPTIYDWIRNGKLKPYKIRSRVYFLYNDIQQLLGGE